MELKAITIRQGLSHLIRAIKIICRILPGQFTLSCAASVLTAVQAPVIFFFSARIIDELAGNRDMNRIIFFVSFAVGLSFLLRIMLSLIQRKFHLLNSITHHKLTQFLGEHYANMDYEYVEDSSANELLADIIAKSRADGTGLIRVIWLIPRTLERFCGMIASAVLLISMFAVQSRGDSFITSSAALWVLVAAAAIPTFLRIFLMKRCRKVFAKLVQMMPKANSIYHYYISYITENAGKEIRIYNQRPYLLKIMKEGGNSSWLTIYSKICSETAGFTAAANAVVAGFTYIFIGLRALAGMYTIGMVTQYVSAVTNFTTNLTYVISNWSMLWESVSYLPWMYQYLDLPNDKYLGTLTTEKRADNEYELEFRNVSFKYPGTDAYALKNLNLKINVGERLAVVGMNGSGKTTMIKLLCRLYDPTEGHITLNRIDIKKYDYEEYMGIFSVVFQDFKLPAFSLGQNVAAAVKYDGNRVRDALGKVGFDAFSAPFSGDLDTVLYKSFDENGVAVSGGEAQKIALARAIYKNAPFVILDEPTAALDPVSEYEIYSKFNDIVENKTAVFISHRLSSCRFCHDIAVFHEGELVQRGRHEELLADAHGKYYKLWNAQAQYYVVG